MTALRPATTGDKDLEALEAFCAAHFSEPWTRWSFLTEIADGGYIPTAWEGETLIGFAAVRAEGDAGYLSLIAVDPAHRRRGVAAALLAAAEDRCRAQGLTRMLLEVRSSNEGAQAFYTANGYQTIARRPAFYSFPREDGLTMQKEPL